MTFQEQPSIALLIDCWSSAHDRNLRPYPEGERSAVKVSMFNNIIKFLNGLEKLQAVCIVTYQSTEYQTLHNSNLYYKNSWDEFLSYRQPLEQRNKFIQDVEIDGKSSNTVTDSIILDYTWPCPQYFITQTWHLRHLIDKNFTNVRDIYVFGESWNNCVRERPLGILNLLFLKKFLDPNVRVLTAKDCILKYNNQNFEMFMQPDEYNLAHLGNGIYDLSNTPSVL